MWCVLFVCSIFGIYSAWWSLNFSDLWFGACTNLENFQSPKENSNISSISFSLSFPSGIPTTGMLDHLISRVADIFWGCPDFRVPQLLAWKYSHYTLNPVFLSCHLRFLWFKYVCSGAHKTSRPIRVTKRVWYTCRIQGWKFWFSGSGRRPGVGIPTKDPG